MPEYLAPGVYVEETSFRANSIEGVGTSTTAFVGPTRRGPVGERSELLTSLGDFERVYGGLQNLALSDVAAPALRTNFLAHAVRAYFDNGGRRLYVVRAASGGAAAEAPLISPVPAAEADRITALARSPGAAGNGRLSFRQTSRTAAPRTLDNAPDGSLVAVSTDGANPGDPPVVTRFRKVGAAWLDGGGTPLVVTPGDPCRAARPLGRVQRCRRVLADLRRVGLRQRAPALRRHRAGRSAGLPGRCLAEPGRAADRHRRRRVRAASRHRGPAGAARRHRGPTLRHAGRRHRRRGPGRRRRHGGRHLQPCARAAGRARRRVDRRCARQQRLCRRRGGAGRAHRPCRAAPRLPHRGARQPAAADARSGAHSSGPHRLALRRAVLPVGGRRQPARAAGPRRHPARDHAAAVRLRVRHLCAQRHRARRLQGAGQRGGTRRAALRDRRQLPDRRRC